MMFHELYMSLQGHKYGSTDNWILGWMKIHADAAIREASSIIGNINKIANLIESVVIKWWRMVARLKKPIPLPKTYRTY